ncbi:hypothetical protein DB346_10975 [Verrucomicrobia bacterium LW23]|nr:hypothetical protein DB346_10975 [Verrucomicrobia bacterium LW23]
MSESAGGTISADGDPKAERTSQTIAAQSITPATTSEVISTARTRPGGKPFIIVRYHTTLIDGSNGDNPLQV